ncbi:hypothetical protein LL037_01530 [Clostridium estertheticum]|uniref:hypothetical protein n=1 Tax=Clostridium estertheticum TaxID=238834 RepID=UPI001C0B1617|nr:hypothetical protein [Clostridium estertheticum]MBU3198156.1 hypothetical protein [Clostridium estertheticum]WAG65947.1 hypothetical protein LL037_01530 [Clostridium estertheticum]
MSKPYIYMEPSIMEYQDKIGMGYDKKRFWKFVTQLDKSLEVIDKLKLKVILNNEVLLSISQHNPTIPFKLGQLKDKDLEIVASQLHTKIRKFITNRIEMVKIDTSCSLSYKLIEESPDTYLDFIELLLSGCSKKSEIGTNLIIKDIETEFFMGDCFKLTCDGECKELQENNYVCRSYKELEQNNKVELVEYQLTEMLTQLRYNFNIDVKQDEHHSVFNNRITSFDSIPSPEKELFRKLNKLVDIKSIHFREAIGSTNKEPCIIYDFKQLEYNDDDENCRVKATISLVSRSSKPHGCKIEMIVKKDIFESLIELMRAKDEDGLTVIFLENAMKLVK